jgi:Ca2+-binding RTX toxin-like protein
LAGGSGNDLYIVDSASDTVTELAAEGSDTVQSTVSYALSTNVENLTLTGSSISGTGNALANAITGNAGANLLAGLEGNDNLTSGEGADTLDGGLGADTLIGGAGDDLYIIDDDGEVVTELAADGVDLVQTSVSYTLGANIENLTMTGSAAIGGTGNALGNVIIGNTGGNALSGLGGNDSLAGGAGSDTLDGGTGSDTLKGGAGNDTYVVDVTTDVLIEVASGGDDLVRSVVTWTLGDELDDLTLTGSAAINGTGNALANTVTGNGAANSLSGGDGNDSLLGASGADTMVGGNGNDYLTGGAGIDTLNGGAGADRFVFNAKAEAGDRINSFVSADDAIRIDASAFGGGLTSGTGFTFASVADDAGLATRAQDFIYNSTTGELWFNANGDAAGGLTKIALLTADPDFVKGDIILF